MQVPHGFLVCLCLATYLSGLIRTHPFMRSVPLIALTCSTPASSTDILIILSSLGIIPVSFSTLPKLSHLDLEPQGLIPLAGKKFGPSFFDLLLSDCSSQAFGPWDPLSTLRTILDSLACVQFECRIQGVILSYSSGLFTSIALFPGFELPESLSIFSVNGTNKFAKFVADNWDTTMDLLAIPDMMGGLLLCPSAPTT